MRIVSDVSNTHQWQSRNPKAVKRDPQPYKKIDWELLEELVLPGAYRFVTYRGPDALDGFDDQTYIVEHRRNSDGKVFIEVRRPGHGELATRTKIGILFQIAISGDAVRWGGDKSRTRTVISRT